MFELGALLEIAELCALLQTTELSPLLPFPLLPLLPLLPLPLGLPPSDEPPSEPVPSDQLNELLIESDEPPFELAEPLPFPLALEPLLDAPDGMTALFLILLPLRAWTN